MVDSGSKAEGLPQSEKSSEGFSRRDFLKGAALLPLLPLRARLLSREEKRGKEDLGLKKEIARSTDYGFEIYDRLAKGDKVPLGRQERRALDLAMLQIGDWIKNLDPVGVLKWVADGVFLGSGLAMLLGLGAKSKVGKKQAKKKGIEGKVVDEAVDKIVEKYKVKGIFKISAAAKAVLWLIHSNQQSEELMIDDLTQRGVEGERRRAERNATINLMMDSEALTEIQWMDAYVVENYGIAKGEWTTQRLFLISKAVEWIEKNNHEVWEAMEKQGGWAGLSKEERMVIIVEEVKQEILRERFLIWPWAGEADLSREGVIELLIVDEELKQMVLDYELDPKDDPYKQEYKEE
jgi:hypothetical protein